MIRHAIGSVIATGIHLGFVWHTDLYISCLSRGCNQEYLTNGFIQVSYLQSWHAWMYLNLIAITYLVYVILLMSHKLYKEQIPPHQRK